MTPLKTIDTYQEKINEQRPFEGTLLDEIKDFYRIGLTYSSNAIEGNTLTESETKVLIEDGLTACGKPLKDCYEAVGHAKAYDFMFTLLHKKGMTEQQILMLHKLFYHSIDEKYAGVYRDIPVMITGSHYPVAEPEEIQRQMTQLTKWVNSAQTVHPVALAAELHKRFVFIHPFKDGNGRVARLLMNTVLIQNRYLPIIIPPILRHDYIAKLEKAHTDDHDFVSFIALQEVESQKDFMRLLHIPRPALDLQEPILH